MSAASRLARFPDGMLAIAPTTGGFELLRDTARY
jgi:hypothetical protein